MRRKEHSRVLATVAAALTLAGCATKADIRDLRTELRDFQTEFRDEVLRTLAAQQDSLMTQLQIEATTTQDSLRSQSEQMFDFRGEMARQFGVLDQGQTRLQALIGAIQVGSVRDQTANQPTTQLFPLETAPPDVETIVGVGGSADQLWDAARDQHSRGSYSTAERAYREFLAEYPDDARAPDAYFHLADILTLQDRPQDALAAFQQVQELDPLSSKVPDALYRIARLQIDMGDTEDAKATLQRIIGTYDGTIMARVAQDLLDDIG